MVLFDVAGVGGVADVVPEYAYFGPTLTEGGMG